jgi:prenyltransferase beta subunit
VIPKKPEPNTLAPSLIESNLSATLFALEALRTAGETDAAMYSAAAIFVRRCQNPDGGFHFIYDDPTRNKAGQVADAPGTFHSYGSTTADGLAALELCNDQADTARRAAAEKWLITHFRADHHPGTYIETHEMNRDAVFYYYAASAARVLRHLKGDNRDRVRELAAQLARRQANDGSWTNPVELVRENEPLVATSNAVLALARCGKP